MKKKIFNLKEKQKVFGSYNGKHYNGYIDSIRPEYGNTNIKVFVIFDEPLEFISSSGDKDIRTSAIFTWIFFDNNSNKGFFEAGLYGENSI